MGAPRTGALPDRTTGLGVGRAGQAVRVADAAAGLELPACSPLQVDGAPGTLPAIGLNGRRRGAVQTETARSTVGASSGGSDAVGLAAFGCGSHRYTIVTRRRRGQGALRVAYSVTQLTGLSFAEATSRGPAARPELRGSYLRGRRVPTKELLGRGGASTDRTLYSSALGWLPLGCGGQLR